MATSKKTTLQCVTHLCPGEIGEGSITGLCTRCYSSIYTWQKRSKADIVKRAMTLRLYEARMNFMLPAKVRILSGDNKYEPLAVMPGQVKKYRKRTKYKMVPKNVKTA